MLWDDLCTLRCDCTLTSVLLKHMNADTKNNFLSIALEVKQHELERARMQLEDQQAKILRVTQDLMEEVSFVWVLLYRRRKCSAELYRMYLSMCDAMEILDPGNPDNYADLCSKAYLFPLFPLRRGRPLIIPSCCRSDGAPRLGCPANSARGS